MDSKICVICNTEMSIDKFYNKDRECNQCNVRKSVKGYYETKVKMSNQRKTYYGKNRDV